MLQAQNLVARMYHIGLESIKYLQSGDSSTGSTPIACQRADESFDIQFQLVNDRHRPSTDTRCRERADRCSYRLRFQRRKLEIG